MTATLTEPRCRRDACPCTGTLTLLHIATDARCEQARRDAEQAAALCSQVGHVEPVRDLWRKDRGSCMRCGRPL